MSEQRTPWEIPRIWPDSTVWIIGGGPSIRDMDLDGIRDQRVIGTNWAFVDFPWIDLLYFGDCQFFSQARKELNDWPGLKVTSCSRVPPVGYGWPRIRRVGRSKPIGIESRKKGFISWNRNTGASAINIAYWLGAKRIILLGFDMKSAGDQTNYHDRYGKRPENWNPYPEHLKCWATIRADAEQLGLEIINATKDSAIQEIEYRPMEELI